MDIAASKSTRHGKRKAQSPSADDAHARSANKRACASGIPSSSFQGVRWHQEDGCWSAWVTFAGEELRVGRYDHEPAAAASADCAAMLLHGPRGAANFGAGHAHARMASFMRDPTFRALERLKLQAESAGGAGGGAGAAARGKGTGGGGAPRQPSFAERVAAAEAAAAEARAAEEAAAQTAAAEAARASSAAALEGNAAAPQGPSPPLPVPSLAAPHATPAASAAPAVVVALASVAAKVPGVRPEALAAAIRRRLSRNPSCPALNALSASALGGAVAARCLAGGGGAERTQSVASTASTGAAAHAAAAAGGAGGQLCRQGSAASSGSYPAPAAPAGHASPPEASPPWPPAARAQPKVLAAGPALSGSPRVSRSASFTSIANSAGSAATATATAAPLALLLAGAAAPGAAAAAAPAAAAAAAAAGESYYSACYGDVWGSASAWQPAPQPPHQQPARGRRPACDPPATRPRQGGAPAGQPAPEQAPDLADAALPGSPVWGSLGGLDGCAAPPAAAAHLHVFDEPAALAGGGAGGDGTFEASELFNAWAAEPGVCGLGHGLAHGLGIF